MGLATSNRARGVGITTTPRNFAKGNAKTLPQRIVILGQGTTGTTYTGARTPVVSAAHGASIYGFGNPIHRALMALFPQNGSGVGSIPVSVLGLQDESGAVAAAGKILPVVSTITRAVTMRALIGGVYSLPVTVTTASTVLTIVAALTAAINAVPEMPVTAVDSGATGCSLTAKWKGATGNSLGLSVECETGAGVTWTLTAFASGATDPTAANVQTALNLIGANWDTLIVNCLGEASGILDTISQWAEARWGALVRKPILGAFYGNVATDSVASGTIPDARKSDRSNVKVSAPGSKSPAWAVAAEWVREVALQANDDCASDYARKTLPGVIPGAADAQWNYTQQDLAVKAGVSTSDLVSGIVSIGDTVTMYHPVGEEPPAYRYVVDIAKLANIVYNVALILEAPDKAGAPLIPDGQPTTNRNAITPGMVKAEIAELLDSLGLLAIIADPTTAKKSINAWIDTENPKRLNLEIPVQLSGNANILSADLYFGFYFGQAPLAA